MNVKLGVTTVVGCFAVGVVAGGCLGWLIGKLAPELVFALLPHLDEKADGGRVSLVLGLINGAWAGLATGIAVMAATTWYQVKTR